jgi:hypothetical protein
LLCNARRLGLRLLLCVGAITSIRTDRCVLAVERVRDTGLVERLELALALLFEEELRDVLDVRPCAEKRREAHGLVELLPDTDGFVVRACHNKVAEAADCERPDLAVMAFQLLDVLKLDR